MFNLSLLLSQWVSLDSGLNLPLLDSRGYEQVPAPCTTKGTGTTVARDSQVTRDTAENDVTTERPQSMQQKFSGFFVQGQAMRYVSLRSQDPTHNPIFIVCTSLCELLSISDSWDVRSCLFVADSRLYQCLLQLSSDVPIAKQEHTPVEPGYTVQPVAASMHWLLPKVHVVYLVPFWVLFTRSRNQYITLKKKKKLILSLVTFVFSLNR